MEYNGRQQWCILVGRFLLLWIERCVFPLILLKFLRSYNFQGTCRINIFRISMYARNASPSNFLIELTARIDL